MNQQNRSPRIQETASVAHSELSARSTKSRAGCCLSWLALLLGLLAGLLVGALGTLLYISSAHDVPAPSSQSVPAAAAIVVQLSPTYLSQMATKDVSQANIPGNLK